MIKPEDYLNSQNYHLWEDLSKKFAISLLSSTSSYYEVSISKKKLFQKQRAIIFVNDNIKSHSSFTHELLHLKLHNDGIDIYGIFTKAILKKSRLQFLFNSSFRSQICNMLDHTLIINEYLEMGFNEWDFLGDNNLPLIDDFRIMEMHSQFKNQNSIRWGYLNLIGTYVSIKCKNLEDTEYASYVKMMLSINSELIDIIDEFFIMWSNCIITRNKIQIKKTISIFVDKLYIKAQHYEIV